MAIPGLIRNFSCSTPVAANRFVAADGADFSCKQANGVGAAILGATEQSSNDNHNRVDVVLTQSCPVEFAGNITAGDQVVADASGKAVALDMAAYVDDAQVFVAGTALESGDAGVIGEIQLNPYLIVK
ncbi:MAG: hypothetical protein VX100_07420 [Pseudomonadota bacterium]|nr:hypothetical protein [Pseudomonadota bacterium]